MQYYIVKKLYFEAVNKTNYWFVLQENIMSVFYIELNVIYF